MAELLLAPTVLTINCGFQSYGLLEWLFYLIIHNRPIFVPPYFFLKFLKLFLGKTVLILISTLHLYRAVSGRAEVILFHIPHFINSRRSLCHGKLSSVKTGGEMYILRDTAGKPEGARDAGDRL